MAGQRHESRYHEVYARWRSDPDGFWLAAADAIDWSKAPRPAAQNTAGEWLADATLNACFNCVDRHVQDGRGAQAAIIYDAPVIAFEKTITYDDLLEEVVALAVVLGDFGVGKGDRVLIYLPAIPRAHVAMLACARIGAVQLVVPGGIQVEDLASYIDAAAPKLVLMASCAIARDGPVAYKPLIDGAIDMARYKPAHVLVWQRPRLEAGLIAGRDHDWEVLVDAASDAGRRADCVPVAADDPLLLLWTPHEADPLRCARCDTGGFLVSLAWTMTQVYGVSAGDVFWTTFNADTSIGRLYGVYGPLLVGATTICFEGEPVGTPDAGAFWRVCAQWKVGSLVTGTDAIRQIREEASSGEAIAGLADLRAIFVAEEPADPEAVAWLADHASVPVIAQWCEGSTGWCIAANPFGLGLLSGKQGSVTVPVPGYAVEVVGDEGRPLPRGATGEIVIKTPLPPGWPRAHPQKRDHAREASLADAYRTAELGWLDEDGYLFLRGRTAT